MSGYLITQGKQFQVLDENDNAPVIVQFNDVIEIPWDADEDFEIAQIFATDADSDENGRLSYLLLAENDRFKIERATGVLRTRKRSGFSNDINATFLLTVEVRDNGLKPLSANTSVNVMFSPDLFMSNFTDKSGMEMEERNANSIIVLIGLISLIILTTGTIVTIKCLCKREKARRQDRPFSLKVLRNRMSLQPNKDLRSEKDNNLREDLQRLTKNDTFAYNGIAMMEFEVNDDAMQHRERNAYRTDYDETRKFDEFKIFNIMSSD